METLTTCYKRITHFTFVTGSGTLYISETNTYIKLQFHLFFLFVHQIEQTFFHWRICNNQTLISQNRKLQQLHSKQWRQKAQTGAALSSLKRNFILSIWNLMRTLPIIESIVRELTFENSLWEMVQATLGLVSSSIVISGLSFVGVEGWMPLSPKVSCSSSLRFSLIVRSTTWAKGTSWQRINQ